MIDKPGVAQLLEPFESGQPLHFAEIMLGVGLSWQLEGFTLVFQPFGQERDGFAVVHCVSMSGEEEYRLYYASQRDTWSIERLTTVGLWWGFNEKTGELAACERPRLARVGFDTPFCYAVVLRCKDQLEGWRDFIVDLCIEAELEAFESRFRDGRDDQLLLYARLIDLILQERQVQQGVVRPFNGHTQMLPGGGRKCALKRASE